MRKFWGYTSNDSYAVGCNGQTIYVYDHEGKELTKFRDIKYVYNAKFYPGKNIFVAKSTGAYFAVYSLDTMSLLQKVKFSKVDASQDDGFCFSMDGKYFYNIERQGSSVHSVISVYDTSNYERIRMFLKEDHRTEPSYIEYDTDGQLFVLGFLRDDTGVICDGFISRFGDNGLTDLYTIPEKEYDDYCSFKNLELAGFAAKTKAMYASRYKDTDMTEIEKQTLPLAELWKKYHTN